MKIGVMSDTHDNVLKLESACEQLQDVSAVIHCGDLCSPFIASRVTASTAPFMIRRLGERLVDVPLHLVWGNNDGDQFLIAKVAADFPAVTLHGQVAHLALGTVHAESEIGPFC